TVAALDAAGNASAPSAPLSVTTPALSVTTPAPPAPFSGTPIAIPGTLEADTFALGGEGIEFGRASCRALVASAASTSASLSGLPPSTPYTFTVAALDAAGNASAPSAPLSVTTPALSVTTPAPPAPFSGTPIAIPGTFEAENFDLGGEGIGYHDVTPGNCVSACSGPAAYRLTEGVDIIASTDTAYGSGYMVTYTQTGEWLAYTINVATDGNYDIEARAATNFDFPNAAYHVEIDGVNVTG